MSARAVFINWWLSSFTGWGVYGLNLALQWCADPDLAATASLPVLGEALSLDPLRWAALGPFIGRSRRVPGRSEGLRERRRHRPRAVPQRL